MAFVDFSSDLTTIAPSYKGQWGINTSVFTLQTRDMDEDRDADGADGSAWGSNFENEIPLKQKALTSVKGLHAGDEGQVGGVLRPLIGKTIPDRAWRALESLKAGSPATFGPVRVKKYKVTAQQKDLVMFDTDMPAAGAVYDGHLMYNPRTKITVTGTGPTKDRTLFGGSTAFGLYAGFHVVAFEGGTTPTVVFAIEDSLDLGVTWVALASFPLTVTQADQSTWVQWVKIPDVVVHAQTRYKWTVTGAPTGIQVVPLLARLPDPDR